MSRPQFVVTPEARADLLEIWNHIAGDSFDRADQVLARLYDAFCPAGAGIRHGPSPARSGGCALPLLDGVIVAVVHGARHLEAFLQNRMDDFPEAGE